MKKITLFTVLLLLLSMFNSCEEDEVNLLLGKWGFVSFKWIEYEDGVKVDEGTSTENEFIYLEFLKGGAGYVYFDEVDYDTFTWEKDCKTVTVDEGTVNEQVIKIETLTKSTLVFSMSYSETYDGVTYMQENIITMTKVD